MLTWYSFVITPALGGPLAGTIKKWNNFKCAHRTFFSILSPCPHVAFLKLFFHWTSLYIFTSQFSHLNTLCLFKVVFSVKHYCMEMNNYNTVIFPWQLFHEKRFFVSSIYHSQILNFASEWFGCFSVSLHVWPFDFLFHLRSFWLS